ncbi:MAG: hypothetical protein ACRDRH_02925 [Pseudonocardia sp.]
MAGLGVGAGSARIDDATRPTVFHLRRARDLIDRHFAEPRRVSPS